MDLFNQLPEDAPVSSEEIRNSSLVKRLRVLLHAFPLFLLSNSDSRRDETLRHYDTLAISLKILDIIAERMGMEVEADREYIDFTLQPLLEGMDKRVGLLPDPERHTQIIERVLSALRNDADARRPFCMTYANIEDNGEVVERQLEFRLLQDAFSLTGETVMRLTNEAVNLYFNALELDIEDSQAATEAIVHSQLNRGRFDEALRSAHYALRQSRLYRDRLSRLLRDTQRDISRVDWDETAPKLISEAMTHLEDRIDVERNIITTTEARLDSLTPGTRESAAVARIGNVISYCIETHTVLQRELMTARTTFLDSQAQQAFVSNFFSSRPELMREVVEPLLVMNVVDAQHVIDNTTAQLMAPQPPGMLSLCFLFDGLLKPKRQQRRDWIEISAIHPDHSVRDLLRHSDADRDIVDSLLRSIVEATLLSDLLAYARAHRFTSSQCDVIVLLIMQHFDVESTESPIVRVEKTGQLLNDTAFFGDEVKITPFSASMND